MQPPKVSVVIPVYNCERYIGDAIHSVQAQTYPASEIIVVDDGSSDGTAAAVQACSGVKYLRQQNRGEPAARNLGIQHAAGDLIAFLDGDDLWTPDKLALQIPCLQAHPAWAMIYSDMATFDDQGVIDGSVKERFQITFPQGNIFRQLFQETLFGSGSVVVRKDVFHKVGMFDESLLVGSDYEMWLRIARHFEVGYVDKPLLMYRQHSSMSTLNLGRALQHGMPWEAVVLKKVLEGYPAVAAECGRSLVNRRLPSLLRAWGTPCCAWEITPTLAPCSARPCGTGPRIEVMLFFTWSRSPSLATWLLLVGFLEGAIAEAVQKARVPVEPRTLRRSDGRAGVLWRGLMGS